MKKQGLDDSLLGFSHPRVGADSRVCPRPKSPIKRETEQRAVASNQCVAALFRFLPTDYTDFTDFRAFRCLGCFRNKNHMFGQTRDSAPTRGYAPYFLQGYSKLPPLGRLGSSEQPPKWLQPRRSTSGRSFEPKASLEKGERIPHSRRRTGSGGLPPLPTIASLGK